MNIQGQCGAPPTISAQAAVGFADRVLFSDPFDPRCWHDEGPAYRRIIVRACGHEITLLP
jgi:hypothetical protein